MDSEELEPPGLRDLRSFPVQVLTPSPGLTPLDTPTLHGAAATSRHGSPTRHPGPAHQLLAGAAGTASGDAQLPSEASLAMQHHHLLPLPAALTSPSQGVAQLVAKFQQSAGGHGTQQPGTQRSKTPSRQGSKGGDVVQSAGALPVSLSSLQSGLGALHNSSAGGSEPAGAHVVTNATHAAGAAPQSTPAVSAPAAGDVSASSTAAARAEAAAQTLTLQELLDAVTIARDAARIAATAGAVTEGTVNLPTLPDSPGMQAQQPQTQTQQVQATPQQEAQSAPLVLRMLQERTQQMLDLAATVLGVATEAGASSLGVERLSGAPAAELHHSQSQLLQDGKQEHTTSLSAWAAASALADVVQPVTPAAWSAGVQTSFDPAPAHAMVPDQGSSKLAGTPASAAARGQHTSGHRISSNGIYQYPVHSSLPPPSPLTAARLQQHQAQQQKSGQVQVHGPLSPSPPTALRSAAAAGARSTGHRRLAGAPVRPVSPGMRKSQVPAPPLPAVPSAVGEASPGRELTQEGGSFLAEPSVNAGTTRSNVAHVRVSAGGGRSTGTSSSSKASVSVHRRDLSPGPPGLPGSRATMAMAPAADLTAHAPPAQQPSEGMDDNRIGAAVQHEALGAGIPARPRSAPASGRHMSAYGRHVARMAEHRASQQLRQRAEHSSPQKTSPRPVSPPFRPLSGMAAASIDRFAGQQKSHDHTRSASAPRVPAQRGDLGKHTASQGLAASADVRAYDLLLRSAATSRTSSSPPSWYHQGAGHPSAAKSSAVSPTRRGAGGILGRWGSSRHQPGVRSSQVLGYAARAGFVSPTPGAGTSSTTTDMTASITRLPGEQPVAGACGTACGTASINLTGVDALLQEAEQAPDLDTAAAATVLAVERLLSPREGPEVAASKPSISRHRSAGDGGHTMSDVQAHRLSMSDVLSAGSSHAGRAHSDTHEEVHNMQQQVHRASSEAGHQHQPSPHATLPSIHAHPGHAAGSHNSTYLTAQVSPDPVWPAVAGRLGRAAQRAATTVPGAAAAVTAPGRFARSPSPGFSSRSRTTVPRFTPSPGTQRLLLSRTVALPDFLTRQNAHLARKQAFVEGQQPDVQARELENVTGRPLITHVAKSLSRSVADLEAWHRRRQNRLALAASLAEAASREEEEKEATFKPVMDARSRRIIQQLGQEDGSPHARATRPWASPPPIIVSPRRGSASPSPSPSPRQPYGAATQQQPRAWSPLGGPSHAEHRPVSAASQRQRASSAGRVWSKGSNAAAAAASDAAYMSMRGPAAGGHTQTTFRAAPFGVEVRGQSQAGWSSGALASDARYTGPPGPTAMAATASAAAASLGAAAAQLGLLPDGGQELAELLSKLQVEQALMSGVFSTEAERASYAAKYRQAKHYLEAARLAAEAARTMAVSPSALQMHPFTSSKGAGVRAASTPRRRITSAPAHAGSLRAHKAPAAAGTTASKSSRTVSPSPMLNKQQGHHANTQVPQQLHSKGGSVESTGHAALQDPQQAVEVPGSAPQAEAAATQQQEAPGTSQEVETAAVSHKPTGKASDTGESSAEERAGDDATARWVARAQAAELQAAAAAAAAAEALARAPPPPVRTRREGPGGRSLSLASPPGLITKPSAGNTYATRHVAVTDSTTHRSASGVAGDAAGSESSSGNNGTSAPGENTPDVWDGTSWDIQANDSITETPLPPTSSALAAVASQQYAAQAAARIRALVAEMEEDRLRHEQGAAAGAVRRASVEVWAGSFGGAAPQLHRGGRPSSPTSRSPATGKAKSSLTTSGRPGSPTKQLQQDMLPLVNQLLMLKGGQLGVPGMSIAADEWLRVQHARVSTAGHAGSFGGAPPGLGAPGSDLIAAAGAAAHAAEERVRAQVAVAAAAASASHAKSLGVRSAGVPEPLRSPMNELASSSRRSKALHASSFVVAPHGGLSSTPAGASGKLQDPAPGNPDPVYAPAHAILNAAASISPLSAQAPAYYESLFSANSSSKGAGYAASSKAKAAGETAVAGGARGALYYETSTSPVRVSALSPPPTGHAAAMLVPVTQRGLVSAAFTAVQQAELHRQQQEVTQGWQGSNSVITAVQNRQRSPSAGASPQAGIEARPASRTSRQSSGLVHSRRHTADSQHSGSVGSPRSRRRTDSRSPTGSPRALGAEMSLPSVAALAAAHSRAADTGAVNAATVQSLANALDALMQAAEAGAELRQARASTSPSRTAVSHPARGHRNQSGPAAVSTRPGYSSTLTRYQHGLREHHPANAQTGPSQTHHHTAHRNQVPEPPTPPLAGSGGGAGSAATAWAEVEQEQQHAQGTQGRYQSEDHTGPQPPTVTAAMALGGSPRAAAGAGGKEAAAEQNDDISPRVPLVTAAEVLRRSTASSTSSPARSPSPTPQQQQQYRLGVGGITTGTGAGLMPSASYQYFGHHYQHSPQQPGPSHLSMARIAARVGALPGSAASAAVVSGTSSAGAQVPHDTSSPPPHTRLASSTGVVTGIAINKGMAPAPGSSTARAAAAAAAGVRLTRNASPRGQSSPRVVSPRQQLTGTQASASNSTSPRYPAATAGVPYARVPTTVVDMLAKEQALQHNHPQHESTSWTPQHTSAVEQVSGAGGPQRQHTGTQDLHTLLAHIEALKRAVTQGADPAAIAPVWNHLQGEVAAALASASARPAVASPAASRPLQHNHQYTHVTGHSGAQQQGFVAMNPLYGAGGAGGGSRRETFESVEGSPRPGHRHHEQLADKTTGTPGPQSPRAALQRTPNGTPLPAMSTNPMSQWGH